MVTPFFYLRLFSILKHHLAFHLNFGCKVNVFVVELQLNTIGILIINGNMLVFSLLNTIVLFGLQLNMIDTD